VVAALELVFLCRKTYRILPYPSQGARVSLALVPVPGVFQFAVNMAFVSSVWLAMNNLDKLLLSKLLSLSDYALFSIAVLLASGVVVISGPMSMALMPRLAKLSAEGDDNGFLKLYRHATQAIGIVVMPACFVLAFFAEEVLWTWTGNREIAGRAWPILATYALGNGILAIGACAYYLQFGKGDLRLHVIGNILSLSILVPTLIWATIRFGPVGAGGAWLVANAIYLALWVPLVHRRFFAGLHRQWLVTDVLSPSIPALLGGFALHAAIRWPDGRLGTGVIIVLAGLALVLLALAGSSMARSAIAAKYRDLVRAP
jgi:O-antigen/teichoic acid export membrane protein